MHPSSYFLKYLLAERSSGEGLSYADACESLAGVGGLSIEAAEFDRLKRSFPIPKGLRFHDRRNQTTIDFMRGEKIFSLWSPVNGEADIYHFLQLPRARETAQILLLGNLSFNEVAKRVNERHRLLKEVSESQIMMLHHYFWNSDITSAGEWQNLLKGDPLVQAYMAAIRGGPEQAMYRAGFDPEVSGKVALKNAFMHLHFRLESTRHLPDNGDTSGMVSRMSKELVTLYDALYGGGEDMMNVLKGLKTFMMTHGKDRMCSIHDLAKGGSYSGQGGKNVGS